MAFLPLWQRGVMAKLIAVEQILYDETPFRQDRYGNIHAVKGNRCYSRRGAWTRYTGKTGCAQASIRRGLAMIVGQTDASANGRPESV